MISMRCEMQRFLTTALVAATFFTGVAYAADANIP